MANGVTQTVVSGLVGGVVAAGLVFTATAALSPTASEPSADPSSVPYADE